MIEGDGATIFRHACKMGLEGIMSKRKDSAYRSGRSPDWLKMKNPNAPAVKREEEEDWGKRAVTGARVPPHCLEAVHSQLRSKRACPVRHPLRRDARSAHSRQLLRAAVRPVDALPGKGPPGTSCRGRRGCLPLRRRGRGARHSRDGIYRCGSERRNSRSARNTLL